MAVGQWPQDLKESFQKKSCGAEILELSVVCAPAVGFVPNRIILLKPLGFVVLGFVVMAACPAVAAARTEFCPRVGAVPNFRVRLEKVLDSASARRLGFDRRASRPLRIMSGYGKCPVRACTGHGGLESCTLYDFLGLPRHATQKNIKAAYRKSAKTWHPDIAMKGQLQKCSEEFVKIRDAYVVLSDPGARAHYDEQLRLQTLQGRKMANRFPGIVSVNQGDCFSIAPGNRKWETDQCW